MKLTLILLCAVVAISLTEAHRRNRCNRCKPHSSSSSSSSSASSSSESHEHHHHRCKLNLRPQRLYEHRRPRYYRFRKNRWGFDNHHHHHHHIRPVVVAPLPVPVFSAPALAAPSYSAPAAAPSSGYQTYTRVANDSPVGPAPAATNNNMNSMPAPPALQNPTPLSIKNNNAAPPAAPEPELIPEVVLPQVLPAPVETTNNNDNFEGVDQFPSQTDSQIERRINREETQQKEFERNH
ncbi:hypothetical protein PRIPAC_96464 [Pristionchus pacificus]|uniref:Uncharacterized protein n=1 Tax=Pristionchus pacificus TaxID=54126 RepID=A0A454XJW1_PRIPA|nr:hypothetical protein PRIPAC_96464 [Pristionchus pacificus]|eukprot:PDM63506.1 hypothetical protein PRIPAC_53863 [Pristionchus pacificus]